jgi:hypothetical protein
MSESQKRYLESMQISVPVSQEITASSVLQILEFLPLPLLRHTPLYPGPKFPCLHPRLEASKSHVPV